MGSARHLRVDRTALVEEARHVPDYFLMIVKLRE
jgi:hypothetical protein